MPDPQGYEWPHVSSEQADLVAEVIMDHIGASDILLHHARLTGRLHIPTVNNSGWMKSAPISSHTHFAPFAVLQEKVGVVEHGHQQPEHLVQLNEMAAQH